MKVHYILPSWAPMAGITLGQRVFAKEGVSETTLAHEAVHVSQQKRDGWKFYTRYVFSPRWRVQYEAEAYVVDLLAGRSLDVLAGILSGPLYLRPCTVEEARRAILEAAAKRG